MGLCHVFLGLLLLISQCYHEFQCKNTRHPRRSDPHTEFPPALCTTFANSSFLFVSRDFRGLFALWTDAVTPGPATVDKPSRLQRTRSPLGHRRCCSWAEEVPLRTSPVQHLPGATVSGCRFLGAPRQSSATAVPSLKTRSSEPSCQL